MKLKYEASRGNRIKYHFMGFEAVNCDWWWAYEDNKWVQSTEKKPITTHRPCRSVKAFKRMLKTAPFGVEFRLCGRWVGHNVYGVGMHNTQNSKKIITN